MPYFIPSTWRYFLFAAVAAWVIGGVWNSQAPDVARGDDAVSSRSNLLGEVPANLAAEAAAAQEKVVRLQNPFTLTNVTQWLLDHGPKLIAIMLGTLVLYLLVKLSGRHFARIVARSGTRGTLRERENRSVTLVGVFRNFVSIAVIIGGALVALDEIGIPIVPLMEARRWPAWPWPSGRKTWCATISRDSCCCWRISTASATSSRSATSPGPWKKSRCASRYCAIWRAWSISFRTAASRRSAT
jgi:hypothetical protein